MLPPQIAASTQIPANDLKRALQSLACVKGKNPLRKEPMGRVRTHANVSSYTQQCSVHLSGL
eukprot:scaffold55146_cov15-Tisochrysis_lutea.AAC.1